MPRTNRPARKDANQAGIEQALRHMGFSVMDTSALGKGCHDFEVGVDGLTLCFELKMLCKNPLAKLTPAEREHMETWQGHYKVVTTLEETLEEINLWRNKLNP